MKRKNIIAIVLACAGVLAVIVGTCSYIGYRFQHVGEGPEHVFDVPGGGALTDEQALSLAKAVMILDHRLSPTLKPLEYGDGKQVNRGTDPQYTTLHWQDSVSGREWYVQLFHNDGKVVGISYPGR